MFHVKWKLNYGCICVGDSYPSRPHHTTYTHTHTTQHTHTHTHTHTHHTAYTHTHTPHSIHTHTHTQDLTVANVEEYVSLVEKFCLETGITRQMEAFKGTVLYDYSPRPTSIL